MGRIADEVVGLLAAGPAAPASLGEALRRRGVTRARDPGAAVRRAVRDDRRVVEMADGRLASIAQALDAVVLTAVVDDRAARAGRLDVEPDLAPLALAGIGPTLPLPPGARAGGLVAVRVDAAEERRISVVPLRSVEGRTQDEAVIVTAVADRLAGRGRPGVWLPPPVTHLGTVALSVAASAPGAMRRPGRPLSAVLADAGYEVHLGWVGPAGTDWSSLTEQEIEALESDAAELLGDELAGEAALALERLVGVLERHLPERVPAVRRRLARTLVRAGRPDEALARLTAAFGEDDPEDRYEAALIAQRGGDDVSARRWVESGLARCDGPASEEVAACLADIGADLDAQAAFLRLRRGLGEVEPDATAAERVARAVVGLDRSYLVEAMVEEVLARVAPEELAPFLFALAELGDDGRDACLAFAAILPPPGARAAREAAGAGARARHDAVVGLLEARPVAAWATSPADAPDQQQLVVTVAKERGRVSPLVVLIDLEELGGGVKDAFFLPDMVPARLRRELFAPMDEIGLPSGPVDLHEAIDVVAVALERTARIGWRIPSLEHQPVVERIERWLGPPQPGGAPRPPVAEG
jgi:hypothetical protein